MCDIIYGGREFRAMRAKPAQVTEKKEKTEVAQMKGRKILPNDGTVPVDRIEAFLFEMVNAYGNESEDDTVRLFRKFAQYLPEPPNSPEGVGRLLWQMAVRDSSSGRYDVELRKEPLEYQRVVIQVFQVWLQAIWEAAAEGEDAVEWALMQLRSRVPTRGRQDELLRADTPFEQAMAYLWRKRLCLKQCANRECPRRYFIGRPYSKVCQLEGCGRAARKAYKKRWWEGQQHKGEHGSNPPMEKPVGEQVDTTGPQAPAEQPGIEESAIKEFIEEVVNAKDEKIKAPTGDLYFFRQYPRFFPTLEADVETMLQRIRDEWSPNAPEFIKSGLPDTLYRNEMRNLRDGLLGAWQVKDLEVRRWQIFRARSALHGLIDAPSRERQLLQPPSLATPVQQALLWVGKNVSKLKTCQNPKCDIHPLFVAKTKERYCTPDCARLAMKESKKKSKADHYKNGGWKKKPKNKRKRPSNPFARAAEHHEH